MALQRYPFRAAECSLTTKATDIGSPFSYPVYSDLCVVLLLPLRYTVVLAIIDPIYNLLYDVESINFWDLKPPFRLPSRTVILVTFCILLPCSITSDSGTSSHEKVHFWISSSWYHFNGRFCCICN
jgi:hypothetical protein